MCATDRNRVKQSMRSIVALACVCKAQIQSWCFGMFWKRTYAVFMRWYALANHSFSLDAVVCVGKEHMQSSCVGMR